MRSDERARSRGTEVVQVSASYTEDRSRIQVANSDGLLAEEHARHLGTINYEITCGINRDPRRAVTRILGG